MMPTADRATLTNEGASIADAFGGPAKFIHLVGDIDALYDQAESRPLRHHDAAVTAGGAKSQNCKIVTTTTNEKSKNQKIAKLQILYYKE